jgi:hypothetical protein
VRGVIVALAVAVLAAPAAASPPRPIKLGWVEQASATYYPAAMTFMVRTVTFGAKAWSVSASVTNRSTKTIQVVRSVTIQAPRYHYAFSLLSPPECKPPAIMCPLVVFAATYFKPAKPSRLGPGQTWSGVFGGPRIPPRGRLISIGFGDFAVPGDTFSYVTQHGFKR